MDDVTAAEHARIICPPRGAFRSTRDDHGLGFARMTVQKPVESFVTDRVDVECTMAELTPSSRTVDLGSALIVI